jgi:hypothetical protein
MKVAQGVILPDDCTAPIYVKYNDLLLQGTPEDVLQGIHNRTKYHATLMHEKLKHTIEDDLKVPRRFVEGAPSRDLQGNRDTIGLSLLEDSMKILEDCHENEEVGEKRSCRARRLTYTVTVRVDTVRLITGQVYLSLSICIHLQYI